MKCLRLHCDNKIVLRTGLYKWMVSGNLPVVPLSVYYTCFGPVQVCPTASTYSSVTYAAFRVGGVYFTNNYSGTVSGGPVFVGWKGILLSGRTPLLKSKSGKTMSLNLTESFNQTSPCSTPIYFIPWSVTLGNGMSIAEPPHDNFSECCAGSQSYTLLFNCFLGC